MKSRVRLEKYINFSLISNCIIFNTLADCCKKGNNKEVKIKISKGCSNSGKNNKNEEENKIEQEQPSQQQEDKNKKDKEDKNKQKQPSQEKKDKEKQKKLQKQKELEENKKKEILKNLKIKYNNKLNQIDSEIKILKSSIKEYFEKNNFEKTVTVEEINSITDPDNEKVGEKLEKLEKEGLKNLKINILNFLKTKFTGLKVEDKSNKIKTKEEDFTNLEKSENITSKDLITLYNKLNTFELILNGDITDLISKIKAIYNELSSKKKVVLEIINDKSLDEKDIDDNNKNQFDLDKENINNVDNEKDINNLVQIKSKLDNLKTKFICKFDKKKIKTKEYHDSLINIYNDLKDNSKIEKIEELAVLNLDFNKYLDNYDDFNEKIKQFELDFIKKIEECTKDYLDNIKEINKNVDIKNKKIEFKNSIIDKRITVINNNFIPKLNKDIEEFNKFIKELQSKNKIDNDIFKEINEFNNIEKESYKIPLVSSLNNDGKFESDKDTEDDSKKSGDEKNVDKIKRLCKKLKDIKSNIDKINEYIKDADDKLTDNTLINNKFYLAKDKVDKEKENLKARKEKIEEYFKTNIFNIFTGLTEDDKNNFNGSENEISFDKISKIYENFKTIKNQQLGLKYEKSSNDFISKIIDEYESKIIRKLLSPLNKFKAPYSETKYKQYEAELKKKNIKGSGSFGEIFLIKNNYVLKVIDKNKDNYNDEDVKNEILISYIFDKDPDIVEMDDYFQYNNKIYLKLKYYSEGSLVKHIKDKFKKEEKEKIYYQLITALSKLHKRGIAHRDIKLENIFVDKDFNVCLADFGKATIFDKNNNYILNLNLFSFPDQYVKLCMRLYNESKELEDKMDLFKNDIFALGLVFISLELKKLTPYDVFSNTFFYDRQYIIDEKDSIKDDELKELLDIMLSQNLNVGNNIDVILGSKYYKRLEGIYGGKS